MQFSILGVPFKCTKDMFTWEKIRSTCFISWAITWRFWLLFGLTSSPIVYALYYFIENNSLTKVHIMLALLCLIPFLFAYYYLKHFVLYQLSFRTMKRIFITEPTKPKWMSWHFWKPQLVALAVSFVALTTLLVILGVITYVLYSKKLWLELVIFSAGGLSIISLVKITLNHIIQHSGTFGFLIEVINEETSLVLDKIPAPIERIKLGLIYGFTSFGSLIAVSSYFNYASNWPYIFEPYTLIVATYLSSSIWVVYTFSIVALVVMVAPTILLALYTHYDALYTFPYKSVSRMYTSLNRAPKCWSLRFLGTNILMWTLTILLTVGLSMLIFEIFDGYVLNEFLVYGTSSLITSMAISVSFIALGIWGFVPVSKQQNSLTK